MSTGTNVIETAKVTTFDVEELAYEWEPTISMSDTTNDSIPTGKYESPIFTSGVRRKYFWCLLLNITRTESANRFYLGLILGNIDRSPQSPAVGFLINKYIGLDQESNYSSNNIPTSSEPLLNIQLIDHKILKEAEIKNRLKANNKLTIYCKIGMKFKKEFNDTSLCQDMESLWKTRNSSSNFSDVTLRTVNAEFLLHKVILTARSPVFAAMFRSNMLESKKNLVELKHDFSKDSENSEGEGTDAITGMLEYIYIGKTSYLDPTNPGKCLQLLVLSDKYDLPGLKAQCELILSASITDENVCEILDRASLYNATILKAAALNFIQKNKELEAATELFTEHRKEESRN